MSNAIVKNGKIGLKSSISEYQKCKQIPGGYWSGKAKRWIYPATPATAKRIHEQFKEDLSYDLDFMNLLKAADAVARNQSLKNAIDLPDVPVSFTKAWRHQKQAFWFAKDLRAAMLAMSMGTGKSKVAVDLVVNRNHKQTLILCPKSVGAVWPDQFKIHSPSTRDIVCLDLTSEKGTVEKKTIKAKEFLQIARIKGQQAIVIINYESAWRKPFGDWAMKQEFDLVILDESHRIKTPGSQVGKFAARLGRTAKYRLALTGTPMPHSPMDIYSQYRFLDSGIFGTSFVAFKKRYAIMGGFQGHEIIGWANEDEMNRKFYSIAYKADKSVIELPEYIDIYRKAELTPKAMKVYRELEEVFWTDVDKGEVTAANALTRLLRLQQVTSGYVRTDEKEEVEIDTSKADLLADIIEDIEIEEPITVFARFRHDITTIKKTFEKAGRSCAELSGSANELKDWQDGKFNSIVVQIQSGGLGISLARARYCIYYSLGFSLGDYEQSRARIHRPGQKREVVYIHLLMKNTIDERVYGALKKKKDVVRSILDREV